VPAARTPVSFRELDFESLRQPPVDLVVRGEGEGPWIEICNRVEAYLRDQPEFSVGALMDSGRDLFGDVLGASYKTNDGQLHRNADAPVIADLDGLPWPAYHLFRMDRYTNLQPVTDAVDGSRSFSILTSRGCPYRCTFCSQSIMPIKWRARSPENVIEEWRHLVQDLGALEIGVLDDSANIRKNRLHVLADALIENRLNHVPWIFVNGIRANLADLDLLTKLKQAGLLRTAFGVETGDAEMLVKIDKHVDHDTIRQAFKNAKAAGIETIGFFIIGLPGDTRESMQRTIDFAVEIDPMIANFSMMTPYPGTIVYEQVKQDGRFLVTDLRTTSSSTRRRYEMRRLTAELVEEMYRKAYRQFYWRPAHRPARSRAISRLNFGRNACLAYRNHRPTQGKDGAPGHRGADLDQCVVFSAGITPVVDHIEIQNEVVRIAAMIRRVILFNPARWALPRPGTSQLP
jgi:radical SAM superfamily enzyme YgiQ (UPF0313 family)